MKVAGPLVLLSFCLTCVGCGGMAGREYWSSEYEVWSPHVENRSRWTEHTIMCGTEKMVFKSPTSLLHAAQIKGGIPMHGVESLVVAYDQRYGSRSLGGSLEFEVQLVVLPDDPSDPFRRSPAEFAEMQTKGTMIQGAVASEVVTRFDRDLVVLRYYFDREKQLLARSSYDMLLGGHHIYLEFAYDYGLYSSYKDWRTPRRKIEDDVMASLRILPAELPVPPAK